MLTLQLHDSTFLYQEARKMRNALVFALVIMLPLFYVMAAKGATVSLEKTNFMPLEQVNIQVGVSGWNRPINVTILLNGYPVAVQTYDAGTVLYVSFLMPNGKPGTLALRVFAKDYNATHSADSDTLTIKRLESSETTIDRIIMGNLTTLMASVEKDSASLNTILTRLVNFELDFQGLLTNVNASLVSEIGNTTSALGVKISTLQNALVALETDAEDLKALAIEISDSETSGNTAITDLQTQVNDLQRTIWSVLVFSSVSAVMLVYVFWRTLTPHEGKYSAKIIEKQESTKAPEPPVVDADNAQEPKEKKLIKRILD